MGLYWRKVFRWGACYTKFQRGQILKFVQRPFWYTVGSVDIITDIVMIIVPGWIVWTLQMTVSKKIVVFMAFAFRIL
jgi:hypothetical protein